MLDRKEAKARLVINKLLEKAGWRLTDDANGKATVTVENHVIEDRPDEESSLGDDFEKMSGGYADYVLWNHEGKPLAVLEAKRSRIHPLDAKEQARDYAKRLGVRWVILSNGSTHFQWNIEEGNPKEVIHLPSPESLESNVEINRDTQTLIDEQVERDYVVLTQMPNHRDDPRWADADGQKQMEDVEGLRFLRPYQLDAIRALQTAVSNGKKRFLFEMATGTGKTLTSAAIIKLFIKTQNASRVLFLVDRLELENQAYKNFRKYLSPDITAYIFKDHPDDWQRAEVVVATIQSIMHNNRFQEVFNPHDFDLIISDEAHRAISGIGASRDVFEYFSGYKLGLTATPKDYLKNLDQEHLSSADPRELERRVQFSTYKTFGCESGDPTFRYSLLDGVKDGFLVNPYVLDCRTKVTTQLLSDEGYAVVNNADDEGEEEAIYHAGDFERKFFSPETNRKFVELFFQKANRDPISGEIGKTIMFCVSQSHARKITQLLNEYALQNFPGLYNSDFALQITSNVRDAQNFTIQFANNNLSGNGRSLAGYKTSKTRICVTVGMMTTGYDCPDLLNICLLRPIFSPQDFVQIKGRGTRKHTFSYSQRLEGESVAQTEQKRNFYLFDFFANCEFFEHDYPYDEIPELPRQKEMPAGGNVGGTTVSGPWDPPIDTEAFGHTRRAGDLIASVHEKQVGYEGMGIDSKLYGVLRDKAQANKEQHETEKEEALELWQEFTNEYELTYDVMDDVRNLFMLAFLEQSIFNDLSVRDYGKFASNPEMWSMLERLGKTWLARITSFLQIHKYQK